MSLLELINHHALGPASYSEGFTGTEATAEIALTEGVVKLTDFLLAGRGRAAGLAELLHLDLRVARVPHFGLSTLYWVSGGTTCCRRSWLVHHHPEAMSPDSHVDPEAAAVAGRQLPSSPVSKRNSQRAAELLAAQKKAAALNLRQKKVSNFSRCDLPSQA